MCSRNNEADACVIEAAGVRRSAGMIALAIPFVRHSSVTEELAGSDAIVSCNRTGVPTVKVSAAAEVISPVGPTGAEAITTDPSTSSSTTVPSGART